MIDGLSGACATMHGVLSSACRRVAVTWRVMRWVVVVCHMAGRVVGHVVGHMAGRVVSHVVCHMAGHGDAAE
eukprot:6468423-Prymnesium_polylepis.1